jgi:hypothetical protein
MRVLFVCLVGGAGCAQLAGIDKTSSPNTATLQLDRASVGATLTIAPQPLDLLAAQFLPDGRDPIDADAVDAGMWSAPVGATVPPVLFTLPDLQTELWDLDARAVHATYVAFEHQNPTTPPAAAAITVDATLDAPAAAGETFQFYEVGTWVSLALTQPAVGATKVTQTFSYDAVILVLRHVGAALTGVAELAPTAPQGDATAVTVTMTAVAKDQNLDALIDPVAYQAKLVGLSPLPTSTLAMAWTLGVSTDTSHGSTLGPTLLTGTPASTDTQLAGTYGNPFAATHQWPTVLTFTATRTRTFTPQDLPATTLASTLVEVGAPPAGMTIGLSSPMPTAVSINQTPLDKDGLQITLDPTADVPVDFITVGDAPLYQIDLVEITGTGPVVRLSAVATSPSWNIPPDYFVAGHTYYLRAATITGGYDDPSTGDLSQISGTIDTASHASGVFTVAN